MILLFLQIVKFSWSTRLPGVYDLFQVFFLSQQAYLNEFSIIMVQRTIKPVRRYKHNDQIYVTSSGLVFVVEITFLDKIKFSVGEMFNKLLELWCLYSRDVIPSRGELMQTIKGQDLLGFN